MRKVVIFDMDGVLIDSEPVYYKIENEMFAELGFELTDEAHSQYVGTKTSEMWADLKRKHGIKQAVDELVITESERLRERLKTPGGMQLIPGVKELIVELYENKYTLAVASSSLLQDIELVTEIFGLNPYFLLKVSGEEVANGKPAPDIFIETAKRLGVSSQECIVIEDSENGVQAAKAAGMKCIGYRGQGTSSQDLSLADVIIESFSEIDIYTTSEISRSGGFTLTSNKRRK